MAIMPLARTSRHGRDLLLAQVGTSDQGIMGVPLGDGRSLPLPRVAVLAEERIATLASQAGGLGIPGVALAGGRGRVTGQIDQALATGADPADASRRIPGDDGVGRHVVGDDGRAPTIANRPTLQPATTIAPAPIEAPDSMRMGLTVSRPRRQARRKRSQREGADRWSGWHRAR